IIDTLTGEEAFSGESARALFELVLDNGPDAVRALGELVPAGPARDRLQVAVDRIKGKLAGLTAELGSKAPGFISDLFKHSPEASRQLSRFVLEDGVGKYAAFVDFIADFSKSDTVRHLLGERGQQGLEAFAKFF